MSTTSGSTVWGFPIHTVYQNVLQFYKREKPQLHLEYNQRIELLALFKLVKLGAYSPDKDTDTGYFDVVGADRRKAWKGLGDVAKEKAQVDAIQMLEGVCPELKDVVLKELKGEVGGANVYDIRKLDGNETNKNDKSTTSCSKDGTPDSTPSNRTQDHSLPSGASDSTPSNHTQDHSLPSGASDSTPSNHTQDHSGASGSTPNNDTLLSGARGSTPRNHTYTPASLWFSHNSAKRFISEFQSSVIGNGSSLTLAAGETVSVQVPTSPQASALVWEVVTEHGNIGFGLSFQRRGDDNMSEGRLERFLPLTLRDCSSDLLIGSHQYKDKGTYLLEFSNSHSQVPQVLYYRVFYQNTSS